MHPPESRSEALRLIEQGINDCEISRRLGIPRATVRDWRRPRYVPLVETPRESCPRCWRAAKPMVFSDEDYAGIIGRAPRAPRRHVRGPRRLFESPSVSLSAAWTG